MGQNKEVWVYGEQMGRHVAKVTLELLGKAAELCPELEAKVVSLLIGSRVEKLTSELSAYGAEKIYLWDEPNLRENYEQVLALGQLVHEAVPSLKCLVVEQTYHMIGPGPISIRPSISGAPCGRSLIATPLPAGLPEATRSGRTRHSSSDRHHIIPTTNE